ASAPSLSRSRRVVIERLLAGRTSTTAWFRPASRRATGHSKSHRLASANALTDLGHTHPPAAAAQAPCRYSRTGRRGNLQRDRPLRVPAIGDTAPDTAHQAQGHDMTQPTALL